MFNEINILKLFFEEPYREFHVREVARLTKLSPATASKKLKLFTKQNILKHKKLKIYDHYKANLDHPRYTDLKTYYNITKLRDSGLIKALNDFYLLPTIVLFGSASFGLDRESSDYDLLIITEEIKEFPEIEEYQRKLNRNLQFFVHKTIKEVPTNLRNSMISGTILQGELHAFG